MAVGHRLTSRGGLSARDLGSFPVARASTTTSVQVCVNCKLPCYQIGKLWQKTLLII